MHHFVNLCYTPLQTGGLRIQQVLDPCADRLVGLAVGHVHLLHLLLPIIKKVWKHVPCIGRFDHTVGAQVDQVGLSLELRMVLELLIAFLAFVLRGNHRQVVLPDLSLAVPASLHSMFVFTVGLLAQHHLIEAGIALQVEGIFAAYGPLILAATIPVAVVVPMEASFGLALIMFEPPGPISLFVGRRQKRRKGAIARSIWTMVSILGILTWDLVGVLDDVLLMLEDVPILLLVACIEQNGHDKFLLR